MRLICPNCGAQYDVDDAVIPDPGRDVQCSNCGHTWFQQPAGKDLETAQELEDEAELEQTATHPGDADRPELDPDVANVLREEAEFETAARASDAESLETQPDLGIDEGANNETDKSAAARARMARLRGGADDTLEEEIATAGVIAAGSRKELLPDVEEITSSLRPAEEHESIDHDAELGLETPEMVREKRSSGRWIFRLIILAVLIAVLVYVFAQKIIEFVPAAEPYLAQYVDAVNGVRAKVDPILQGAFDKVKTTLEGLTGADTETPEPSSEADTSPEPVVSEEDTTSETSEEPATPSE